MGTLKINSRHSEAGFSYVEDSYTLQGNAQADTKTTVMTSFNASVYKTTDGSQTVVGSVSTNYDQSKGEDGLSYNFYNMGINDIIAVAPIVKNCAEAIAEKEKVSTVEDTTE